MRDVGERKAEGRRQRAEGGEFTTEDTENTEAGREGVGGGEKNCGAIQPFPGVGGQRRVPDVSRTWRAAEGARCVRNWGVEMGLAVCREVEPGSASIDGGG